ncbi:MAG: phosphoribosylanthranilate isomerase [Promethearchaeota archaeon]
MVEIKICGIKDIELARYAQECGASFIGIVVHTPDSPRNLPLPDALELSANIGPGLKRVFVTRTLTRELVDDLARCDIDYLQIHDHVKGSRLESLRTHFTGSVIFGLSIKDPISKVKEIGRLMKASDLLLVDGSQGRGIPLNPMDLKTLAGRTREILGLGVNNLMVAGGFTPASITSFLDDFSPFAIDASSGLESSRGVKDKEKIKRFCFNVKNHDYEKIIEKKHAKNDR